MNDYEYATYCVDDHLTDGIQQSRYLEDGDGNVLVNEVATDHLPEELMEKLEDCLGDGLAGVSVSGDMAVNDFGTKAGAHVSVRVTCGNNEQDIRKAHGIARGLMEDLLEQNMDMMEEHLEQRLSKKRSSSSTEPSKPAPVARRSSKKGGTVAQPTASEGVTRKPVAVKRQGAGGTRPAYRR